MNMLKFIDITKMKNPINLEIKLLYLDKAKLIIGQPIVFLSPKSVPHYVMK